MPIDYGNYPKNWIEIGLEIKARAGGQCECTGECGVAHLHDGSKPGRCPELNGHAAQWAKGRIILTVAHLGAPKDGKPANKRDKMDVRPENLKAMCQRCHLRFDRDEHRATSAATRRAKRLVLEPMFPGMEEL